MNPQELPHFTAVWSARPKVEGPDVAVPPDEGVDDVQRRTRTRTPGDANPPTPDIPGPWTPWRAFAEGSVAPTNTPTAQYRTISVDPVAQPPREGPLDIQRRTRPITGATFGPWTGWATISEGGSAPPDTPTAEYRVREGPPVTVVNEGADDIERRTRTITPGQPTPDTPDVQRRTRSVTGQAFGPYGSFGPYQSGSPPVDTPTVDYERILATSSFDFDTASSNNSPNGIAFDGTNFFIAQWNGVTVYAYSSTGSPVSSKNFNSASNQRTGMAFDGEHLFILAAHGTVSVYETNGDRVRNFESGVTNANAIAVTDDRVYVIANSGRNVRALTKTGTRQTDDEWTLDSANTATSGFTFAMGKFWVADRGDDKVYAYNEDGSRSSSDDWNLASREVGGLTFAMGMFWSTNRSNKVFAYESNGSRRGAGYHFRTRTSSPTYSAWGQWTTISEGNSRPSDTPLAQFRLLPVTIPGQPVVGPFGQWTDFDEGSNAPPDTPTTQYRVTEGPDVVTTGEGADDVQSRTRQATGATYGPWSGYTTVAEGRSAPPDTDTAQYRVIEGPDVAVPPLAQTPDIQRRTRTITPGQPVAPDPPTYGNWSGWLTVAALEGQAAPENTDVTQWRRVEGPGVPGGMGGFREGDPVPDPSWW